MEKNGPQSEVGSDVRTQSPDFYRVQQRATEELNTTLYYRRIDVRDTDHLNDVIEEIANREGRLDGLVAAAGIQQETPALEYTAKDANTMFEVNITGVFMTAQAAAKQMIRFGNGGSIVMIASMSGTVANRVSLFPSRVPIPLHRAMYCKRALQPAVNFTFVMVERSARRMGVSFWTDKFWGIAIAPLRRTTPQANHGKQGLAC